MFIILWIFVIFVKKINMSEQELNSYRFGRGEDPSDEMLEAIMKDAIKDVRLRAERAQKVYKAESDRIYQELSSQWASRIENARNGIYRS